MGDGPSPTANFHGNGAPNPALVQQTPHLFDAAQQHMPSSYFGNQQIHDPSAILSAYMQYLPDFLASTRSQNSVQPPVPQSAMLPAKMASQNQQVNGMPVNGLGNILRGGQ